MGKKRIDLTGQKFGRLVVISLNEEVSKQSEAYHKNFTNNMVKVTI